ncbi:FlaA1/EpsC-like NDP-sugar epimerase [Natronocella acetinitrilica]|uniref:FlaA1/EpsC-like NDP-sugar epimerase n=1 Tax=Natronocella acetinitrilica TaxID=414046 RepID=A0AAE3G1N3_9GAMM|nr:nucleoside-diphosphate sugar epimerase/dehydratase [Natronocella acetinitrilica]MCP1673980.1 FlaA1/EpsC-like NDP-sugar epimerase [Natronocella acetinitrilica]
MEGFRDKVRRARQYLGTLPRLGKRLLMVATDLLLLSGAVWAAFALRLGDPLHPYFVKNWWLVLAVPAIAIPCFYLSGLYSNVVRYMGPQAVSAALKGAGLATLSFIALVAVLRLETVPRTSYVIFFLLVLALCGGIRFVARTWFQALMRRRRGRHNVAIYGAGHAGAQLAVALEGGVEFFPRAFVDDDSSTHGQVIAGRKVFSPDRLPWLIERYGLTHVLLAMPSLGREQRRRIVNRLEQLPVHIKTMPALADLVSGRARVSQVQEVDIDDLLGREGVVPNEDLLHRALAGRVVLVTGAGGSIGSEICRQVLQRAPVKLLLLEQSEHSLYAIERQLQALVRVGKLGTRIVPLLGTVTNSARLRAIMQAYGVEVVYHAAAYKHVPIVEENVLEGVENNIFGTRCAAEAAMSAGVPEFVLISTDKAVRPTNVMGASKRMAELILQALAERGGHGTRFSMVRFGNVLGSSGSVVPLFRDQIRRGGPVTVTHEEITRYFMSIPEAATLVIQAGAMAEGGDVFVLDMGEPVKIVDLARRMIHLSGFTEQSEDNPGGDIAIEFTGLRPGEKLYEELLLGDNVTRTSHPMIMRAQEARIPWDDLSARLDALAECISSFDFERAREIMASAVEGYAPQGVTFDLLGRQLTTNAQKTPTTAPSSPERRARPH